MDVQSQIVRTARQSAKLHDGRSLSIRTLCYLVIGCSLVACGGGGGGSGGTSGGTEPPPPPPPVTNQAPTNVRLIEVASMAVGEIRASWLPASDDSTPSASLRYQLHVSASPEFVISGDTLRVETTGQLSASIATNLISGARYFVRVVAIDQQGAQTASDSMPVTVADTPAALEDGITLRALSASEYSRLTSDSITLASGVAVPATGSYVASADNGGFLRQVTAATSAGGATSITTRRASLNEVVTGLQVSSSVRMTPVPVAAVSSAREKPTGGASATTEGSSMSVTWEQAGLSYSAGAVSMSGVGSASANVQAVPLALVPRFDVGPTTTVHGKWAKVRGPEYVALEEGAKGEVLFTVTTTTDDTTGLFGFGSRVGICKLEAGVITNEDPGARPREVGVEFVGELRLLQFESGTGRVKAASQMLSVLATSSTASNSPYKVKARAILQDVDEGCKPSSGWREVIEFDIDIYVGNDAFPSNEASKTVFQTNSSFSVTNDAVISFDPTLSYDYRIGRITKRLDYAKVMLEARPMVIQTLTIHADSRGTIDDRHDLIAPRKFFKVYVTPGGLPVVVSGEFKLELHVEGEVSGALQATEELRVGFDRLAYGIECVSGKCEPIEKRQPKINLKVGGNGKAEAFLTLSLLPSLKLNLYESLSGKVVLEPYVDSRAGIEGLVQYGAEFDPGQQLPALAADADYRLTKAQLGAGLNAYLYADLHVLDFTLLEWPSGANVDDYKTYKTLQLARTVIADLPALTANVDMASIYPSDARAIRIKAEAKNVPNPWKILFPSMRDSLIEWARWTTPRVIAPLGVPAESYAFLRPLGSDPSEFWVLLTRPGTYLVRLGGVNSWGPWARQYMEIPITVTDSNGNGILDHVEARPATGNKLPTVNLLVSPTSTGVGQPIAFDSNGSTDADGTIVSWTLDFGDGQSFVLAGKARLATSHSYASVGTYQVRLTGTDDRGGSATATASVAVSGSGASGSPGTVGAVGSTRLAISASADPVRPGQLVQYAVTVTNGSAENRQYIITAQVPMGMSVPDKNIVEGGYAVRCGGNSLYNTSCMAGQVISWGTFTGYPAQIGAGQSVTVGFAAIVDTVNPPSSGTVLRSLSTVTEYGTSGAHSGATAAVDVVVSATGLSLGIVDSPQPVAPGGTLNYTLRFGSPGAAGSPATNLVMALPSGTSFVSASNGGVFANGTVQWAIGALGAGANGTRQLVLAVDPQAATGSVINVAADLRDSATGQSLARTGAATAVLSSIKTRIAATASADPVRPGQLVQYAVTVTNGSAENRQYIITAQVPMGMSVPDKNIVEGGYAVRCGGNSLYNTSCMAGQVISWGTFTGYPAQIGAGQSVTVGFAAIVDTVNPPSSGTVLRSLSTVTEYGTSGAHSGATAAVDVVVSATGLSLGIVDSPQPVAPGGTLNYTLRFGSPGAAGSPATNLVMALPSGTSFVSASNGGVFANGTVQWAIGALGAGANGTRQLVLAVDPQAATGSVINVAADLRDSATGQSLARTGAATAVLSSIKTRIAATASADPVRPGQLVQYAVTVTNGSAENRQYIITAQVPMGMSVPDKNIVEGGYAVRCGGNSLYNTSCMAGQVISWGTFTGYPAQIGAGQSVTVGFAAIVDTVNPPSSGTVLRSLSTVTEYGTSGAHSGATAAVDVVVSATGLSLGIVDSPQPVAPGGTLNYTLRFGSPGAAGSPATNLVMALPSGTSFVSASNGGVFANGTVQWAIGALGAGANGTRQLVLAVDPQAATGSVINVAADLRDSATGQSLARTGAATAVLSSIKTRIAATASADPVRPGQLVQYAVTVTNGSAENRQYIITAQVPMGMSVPDKNIVEGGYAVRCGGNSLYNTSCMAGQVISWGTFTGYPAQIGAGQSVTVGFAAIVDTVNPPSSGTVLRSLSTVTEYGTSGAHSGATAAVDVVVSATGLSLGIVDSPQPVAPGGTLNYTLRFGSPGAAGSPATNLVMALPSGTSFVSASNGGVFANGTVQWAIGALGAGANGTRQLVLAVDPQAATGSVINVAADLRDSATGQSLARTGAATAVLSSIKTRIAATASADPVRPGQLVQYAVTVTNGSAENRQYIITAQVPMGMSVPDKNIVEGGYAVRCGGNSLYNTSCMAGQVISWGTFTGYPAQIGAGQSVTVGFAAIVDTVNPPSSGTVLRSLSTVTEYGTSGAHSGATAAVDVVVIR